MIHEQIFSRSTVVISAFLIFIGTLYVALTYAAEPHNNSVVPDTGVIGNVLVLDSDVKMLDLNAHAGFIEDPYNTIVVEELASQKYDSRFTRVKTGIPNFGFTSSTFWVSLQFKSNFNKKTEWVLEVPYAALDQVEVFIFQQDNSYIVKKAGDSVNFSLRDIEYHKPSFYLQIPPNAHQKVFLRIKTTSSMQLPLVLWDIKTFTNNVSHSQLFWGIFFGVMLIAASYNLFLFFPLRDTVFLYYVLFVLSLFFMQLTLNGFSVQYFWPESPHLSNDALLILLNLTLIFATFFSKQFLKLKHHAPLLNKGLTILFVFMVFDLCLTFIAPYSLVLRIFIFGLTLGGPLFILSGIVCWRKGSKPARLYLFAWLVLVGGGIAYALKTWNYLPVTPLSKYALPIGSAFEVILFSIALSLRVYWQQKETHAARKAMLEMQFELFEANKVTLKNAQESDRLKQEFLATMSHELRTPMNGILGCCQLLEDLDLPDEDRLTINSLEDSASQMMRHVNRILNFSQLNEGTLSIDNSLFGLDDIVNSLKSNFEVSCKAKGLEFDVNVNSVISKNLIGDKHKIIHVLNDLVDNAVKFTSRGMIQVSIAIGQNSPSTGDNVKRMQVYVRDSGIGVDEESQQTIFTMFAQKDGAFNRSYQGLGLGLAICKKYVELMEGEIFFKSSPGAGTCVELLLPVMVVDPQQKSAEVLPDLSGDSLKATILVVEDNLANQKIMERMLINMGHTVMIAENGVEALDILESDVFDLIFMDCQMPVMDGFETTARIRNSESIFKKIPIIAVTANAMAGDRERCLSVGMNDYLSKPVSRQSLKAKANFWLGDKFKINQH